MLRTRILLLTVLFPMFSTILSAQDVDYFRHRKTFDICYIHKQCSGCYSCDVDRCKVKIQNKSNEAITGVYYKYYSPVLQQVVEKEAKIEGGKIPGKEEGQLFVCVSDAKHWIFSRVEYMDQSSVSFTLNGKVENYLQEADECDCND